MAKGEADRFISVYEQYKKAPDVTRKRIFIETMEKVLGDTDKVIVDGKAGTGVVPYPAAFGIHQEGSDASGGPAHEPHRSHLEPDHPRHSPPSSPI